MVCETRIVYTIPVDDASQYTGHMSRPPGASQPARHPGALLDHLARRMRLRAEAVLAPLGLGPRHPGALTGLRGGRGATPPALAAPLGMGGTTTDAELNAVESRTVL